MVLSFREYCERPITTSPQRGRAGSTSWGPHYLSVEEGGFEEVNETDWMPAGSNQNFSISHALSFFISLCLSAPQFLILKIATKISTLLGKIYKPGNHSKWVCFLIVLILEWCNIETIDTRLHSTPVCDSCLLVPREEGHDNRALLLLPLGCLFLLFLFEFEWLHLVPWWAKHMWKAGNWLECQTCS